MKILIKYILIIVSSLLLASCSLSLGGLVALDNSIVADSKDLDLNKLSKLKEGTKVIIGLTDSTIISGTFKTYEEIITNKSKEAKITLASSDFGMQIIKTDQVIKCTIIDEGSSIWTAVAIGATIDAILLYISLTSKSSLGTGRIF